MSSSSVSTTNTNTKKQEPTITSATDLSNTHAKWTALRQIDFVDQTGQPRTWEMAVRRTRGSSGVDAVAIGNILVHRSRPPSTMLVIQYRPPMDAYTVEWPAGLVDAHETPEQAALRELKEETGFTSAQARVVSVGPVVASDPGLTNANLVVVMVEVQLDEDDDGSLPEQRLDDGEYITRVVVPLAELYDRLVEYSRRERTIVAAKLFNFAAGMDFVRHSGYMS